MGGLVFQFILFVDYIKRVPTKGQGSPDPVKRTVGERQLWFEAMACVLC